MPDKESNEAPHALKFDFSKVFSLEVGIDLLAKFYESK